MDDPLLLIMLQIFYKQDSLKVLRMSEEAERESTFLFYAKVIINIFTALTLFFVSLTFYFLAPITVNIEGIGIALPIITVSSVLLHFLDVKYRKINAGYLHYFFRSLRYLFLVIPFWVLLAVIVVSGGNPLLTLVFLDLMLVAAILFSIFNPRIRALKRKSVKIDNQDVKDGAEEITRRMGIKVSEIKIIDTERVKIANAFQIGLIHPYVFVTSFLSENLTTNENIAIIAHELAHAQRKHVQKTFLFLGTETVILGNIFFLATVFLFHYGLRVGMFAGIFVSSFISVYILLPFLQRRFEKEADIVAASYIQPGYLIDSLRKISKLNHIPLNIPRYWNMSHPTTLERIAYLSNLKEMPKERGGK
jgi:Zn-dependent protease with chaperone function